jgi:hypothetical protein
MKWASDVKHPINPSYPAWVQTITSNSTAVFPEVSWHQDNTDSNTLTYGQDLTWSTSTVSWSNWDTVTSYEPGVYTWGYTDGFYVYGEGEYIIITWYDHETDVNNIKAHCHKLHCPNKSTRLELMPVIKQLGMRVVTEDMFDNLQMEAYL